ncbi:hypothetical protein E3G54_003748 [Mycobacteroides abscessus]|nr:hypothetical protein [Mycobacteroides abscessus]
MGARPPSWSGLVGYPSIMVYRGVRGGVEDRWFKKVKQSDGSTVEVPSKAHGIQSRWKARYVDAESNERYKVFEVKREAEAWLRDRLSEVTMGTHIDPRLGKITVTDVYKSWESAQGHIAKKTAATRKTAWTVHVHPRWAKIPISEVKTTAVRAWVAKLVKDEVGVPTIENSFHVLRMVMASAVEDGRIPRNPCEGVKLPKRQHADRGYLTHNQVLALSDACSRDGLVVRFLAYTGLRWGEMAALRVQDFDMQRRRVSISRSVTESGGLDWKTPKTWERRSVPFPSAVSDELSACMTGKKRAELVFTDLRGGVLRVSNWRDRVFAPAVSVCQEADETLPTITPHDLRHTAASLAISAGANVKAVQRMLGHARASMTLDTYADLFDADLDEVAGALDVAITAAQKNQDETPAASVRHLHPDDPSTANEETPD